MVTEADSLFICIGLVYLAPNEPASDFACSSAYPVESGVSQEPTSLVVLGESVAAQYLEGLVGDLVARLGQFQDDIRTFRRELVGPLRDVDGLLAVTVTVTVTVTVSVAIAIRISDIVVVVVDVVAAAAAAIPLNCQMLVQVARHRIQSSSAEHRLCKHVGHHFLEQLEVANGLVRTVSSHAHRSRPDRRPAA